MARAGSVQKGRMDTLTRVLFAGEELPVRYLADWMSVFPEKLFFNAYGPTEATGVSTCYQIATRPDSGCRRIPIGKARDGARIILLDEEMHPVPTGELGEICITGEGLAKGYLDDPDKTAQFFVKYSNVREGERLYKTGDLGRMLPDGNLEYICRKDRQLKFMGYRIEAGEVENALMSLPEIRETAVRLIESKLGMGVKELVAFLESDQEISIANITSGLKAILPPYMIPKQFIQVERMPRCNRGKIDLDALNNFYQSN